MRPRLFYLAALVAAAFITQSPRAQAEVLTLTLTDNGTAVTYKPNGGTATTINAGPFHWTQETPLNANYSNSLTSYCIDLDHFISKGSTYEYTAQNNLKLAPTIGDHSAKIDAINELFDHYYKSSLTSDANAAAFQIALWELVYDGASSKSLSSGRIQASNTKAQSMLSSLGKSYSNHDLSGAHLTALVSEEGAQGQITVTVNQPPVSGVPAPPTALLAGIGFLALAGRFRRSRRTAA